MFSSPRRIGAAIRLALARRPWIRWLVVTAIALGAGWSVFDQLEGVDDARRSWGESRTVLVAAHEHAPGEQLVTERRRLPLAAVPAAALSEVDHGETARQRIGAGEVLTSADVDHGAGPAAAADDGTVVVAVSDPLLAGAMSTVTVGLDVVVHGDGIVLADGARIVAIDGEVVFVALDPRDAAQVSAAAQMRTASLGFPR